MRTVTRKTYTLTRGQCEGIKNADRVYALNARQMMLATRFPNPNGKGWAYPSWVTLNLKRLGDEAIRRWEKAHPIPKTVIEVAFNKAQAQRQDRRAA